MSTVTYKVQADGDIAVRLDGRKVGEIRLTPGGFRYYPTGAVNGGAYFSTLQACKDSLEAE